MGTIDLKKALKPLFTAPAGEFIAVEIPSLQFLKVDGGGDPNVATEYQRAVQSLFSAAYAIRFAAKAALGKTFVVPPLEGLWWSDDPQSFVDRRKSEWKWTMMIMIPDFVGRDFLQPAMDKTAVKLGELPSTFRMETHDEGLCLQALHIGSYDDEGPLLARLHSEIMPDRGYGFGGPHHEIYLSDPRKTHPSRLKTILRQPVVRVADIRL